MTMCTFQVPSSADLHMQSGIPFGLLVQPMAEPGLGESSVPVVDFGAAGPVRYLNPVRSLCNCRVSLTRWCRCGRCRAYINPFDTFVRGGTHYVCSLCSANNEVRFA
jgi:protein transport protein SEC24